MKHVCRSLILLFIFLFLGCAKKKQKDKVYVSKTAQRNSKQYKLKVDGIECKLCASLSVKALESVPGVLKAEFICLDKNFKNYFIKLYLKNSVKDLNIKDLREALKKEGFKLISASGDKI